MLHWPQLQALLGLRIEPARLLRRKREPLGGGYALGTVGMMLAFELLPHVEEALRDWRARPAPAEGKA